MVPGTKHHVLVICGRSEGLRSGQRQVEDWKAPGRLCLKVYTFMINYCGAISSGYIFEMAMISDVTSVAKKKGSLPDVIPSVAQKFST